LRGEALPEVAPHFTAHFVRATQAPGHEAWPIVEKLLE
jgi:hypothetical protein